MNAVFSLLIRVKSRVFIASNGGQNPCISTCGVNVCPWLYSALRAPLPPCDAPLPSPTFVDDRDTTRKSVEPITNCKQFYGQLLDVNPRHPFLRFESATQTGLCSSTFLDDPRDLSISGAEKSILARIEVEPQINRIPSNAHVSNPGAHKDSIVCPW